MMILENVRPSLRKELSRWLMEVKAGVFLGHISALVREELWKKCRGRLGKGGIILVYSWPNEQGFAVQSAGKLSREIVDCEGLYLVRKPLRDQQNKKAKEIQG